MFERWNPKHWHKWSCWYRCFVMHKRTFFILKDSPYIQYISRYLTKKYTKTLREKQFGNTKMKTTFFLSFWAFRASKFQRKFQFLFYTKWSIMHIMYHGIALRLTISSCHFVPSWKKQGFFCTFKGRKCITINYKIKLIKFSYWLTSFMVRNDFLYDKVDKTETSLTFAFSFFPFQTRRDQSITFSYRESYPGGEILRSTEGLDGRGPPEERVREVYVRRRSGQSGNINQ